MDASIDRSTIDNEVVNFDHNSKCNQQFRNYSQVQIPLKLYSLEGRYASALFSAATKNQQLPGVESELNKIKATLKKSEQLRNVLNNPVIDRNSKKNFVSKLLLKENYSSSLVNFFKVLAENGRLSLTDKVLTAFEDIMKAQRGQVDVKIVSAKEMSKEAVEKLKETIGKRLVQPGQQPTISFKIDPAILGGLVIQFGDKTIDMSTSTKVRKIKQSIEA